MKKLTLIIAIIASMNAFGQEQLIYTEVVQVDSVSDSDLFKRAQRWFASAYKSASDVVQIEDKESGEIMGKALLKYDSRIFSGSGMTNGSIKYTIKVLVRDGRYKYEIGSFFHDPYGNVHGKTSMGIITTDEKCPTPKPKAEKWSDKVWDDIKQQIESSILPLVDSLKSSMGEAAEYENDDW